MATQTKKKTSSSSKKRTSSSSKKTASSKNTKTSAAQREAQEQSRRQLIAVLLFAGGILFFFLTVIRGENVWRFLHESLFGLFGWCAFLIAPIMIYIAILASLDAPIGKVENKIWQTLILILLICGITHVFSADTNIDLFTTCFTLFQRGKELSGGGFAAIIFGVPMLALLGKTPAAITIIVLIFVMVMVITGSTLKQLGKLSYKPVKSIGEAYNQKMLERSQADDSESSFVPINPDEYGMPPHPVHSPKKLELDIDEIKQSQKKLLEISGANNIGLGNNTPSPSAWREEKPEPKPKKSAEPADKPAEEDADVKAKVKKNPIDDIINKIQSNKEEKTKDSEPETQSMSDSEIQKELDSFTIDTQTGEVTPVSEASENKLDEALESAAEDKSEENTDGFIMQSANPYRFPPVDMLKLPKAVEEKDVGAELSANAECLVSTLKSFGVQTKIIDITRGPTVTRYELQPSAGVKISKITSLADDIALNLASAGVRIEAPIPNKAAVGIEVPNKVVGTVSIREIIDSDEFRSAKSKLTVSLGRDIAGKVAVMDIAKMPHVLIAGATGSGKSVCINSIIVSILYKSTPDEVRLLMVDPKVVELGIYNGIPHLLVPVVTDPRKASGALNWAVNEMLKRYKTFADNSVRDIKGYNELAKEHEELEPMPQIVIIIDELADLMMAAPDEVEDSICRLAQMARAAGMHLVIATQRPSVDVITGVIKANIPSRIAFTVSSQVDSRTILDSAGADKLLGRGDMLYMPVGAPKPMRIQGCFVSDKEVESVVEFIKKSSQEETQYDEDIIGEIEKRAAKEKGSASSDGGGFESDDPMLPAAIECVVEMGQASTSMLQRRLKLGYARAARLVDEMEARGIVGPYEGSKPRTVLMTKQQWIEMKLNKEE